MILKGSPFALGSVESEPPRNQWEKRPAIIRISQTTPETYVYQQPHNQAGTFQKG
jgi:hypothetical protein